MEPFTLIEEPAAKQLFDRFQKLSAAPSADHDIEYQAVLRERFSDLTVTAIPAQNCDILSFAAAGHASAEPDTTSEPFAGWRGWIPDYGGAGKAGIGASSFFGRYNLKWKGEQFILYSVGRVQYVLKEPAHGQSTTSTPTVVDDLITNVGRWQQTGVVWVYDNYWKEDKNLYDAVQKASWDKVILDESTKKALLSVSTTFFDNRDLYDDIGIAWKRGIIFHGPPGNGKTISIKALMHTLHERHPPIPTLYVKSAPYTFSIAQVFSFARNCSPCLLIFEDVETIINPNTRSYFLNEIDGLESNDGILMVATTNFLDRLDPGITKRPSRFDRLFLFPSPNTHERTLYAEYWRHKVLAKDSKRIKIEFPERLCPAMASITDGFSFAYMQEAYVASLLSIAQGATEKTVQEAPSEYDTTRMPYSRSPASQALYAALNSHEGSQKSESDELDHYKLWKVFKDQVRMLRENMGTDRLDNEATSPTSSARPAQPEPKYPLPDFSKLRLGSPARRNQGSRSVPPLQPLAQTQAQLPMQHADDPSPFAGAESIDTQASTNGALPAKVQFINSAAYQFSAM